MHIFREIQPLRAYLKQPEFSRQSIGLVPTMGALHEGHLALLRASRKENEVTVTSIFVNPAQFNNPADLERYPRTLEKDLRLLEEHQCDAVFCPSVEEMYPNKNRLNFKLDPLDKTLEGEFRPGHFSGVALVVAKLFNIVHPDRAYFGQKDYQQYLVVSKLVSELSFGIQLICVPIVREKDGLAMSSRNARLTDGERKKAITLYQCLKKTRSDLLAGVPFADLKKQAHELCRANDLKLEYLAHVDRSDLTPIEKADPERGILLIAAYVGEVRLIDNLYIGENGN